MKAYLIDPETQTISLQEYDGQPHSLYTLFGTLLVDADDVLHEHTVYSAGEAFERGERGFFLGEKLLFGKTLVTGQAGFEEVDASIDHTALEALTMFELPEFYKKTLGLLPPEFTFGETYELSIATMSESVSVEWVFYVFNMADSATKTYFLNHLENTVTKGENIHDFLKKMGELAVRSTQ